MWEFRSNFFVASWGIPNGCRARSIFFLKSSLQPKANAYPSIGQKKFNGAAARMMLNFFAERAQEIQRSHPWDVYGWPGVDLSFWLGETIPSLLTF